LKVFVAVHFVLDMFSVLKVSPAWYSTSTQLCFSQGESVRRGRVDIFVKGS
jgi:hypothetical protein